MKKWELGDKFLCTETRHKSWRKRFTEGKTYEVSHDGSSLVLVDDEGYELVEDSIRSAQKEHKISLGLVEIKQHKQEFNVGDRIKLIDDRLEAIDKIIIDGCYTGKIISANHQGYSGDIIHEVKLDNNQTIYLFEFKLELSDEGDMYDWNENTVLRCTQSSKGESDGEPWFTKGHAYTVEYSPLVETYVIADNQGYKWNVSTIQCHVKDNEVAFENITHNKKGEKETMRDWEIGDVLKCTRTISGIEEWFTEGETYEVINDDWRVPKVRDNQGYTWTQDSSIDWEGCFILDEEPEDEPKETELELHEGMKLKCTYVAKDGAIQMWYTKDKEYEVKHDDLVGFCIDDNDNDYDALEHFTREGNTFTRYSQFDNVPNKRVSFEIVPPVLDLNKLSTTQLQQYLIIVNLVEHNEKVVKHAQDEVKEAEKELEQSKEDLEKFKNKLLSEVNN